MALGKVVQHPCQTRIVLAAHLLLDRQRPAKQGDRVGIPRFRVVDGCEVVKDPAR